MRNDPIWHIEKETENYVFIVDDCNGKQMSVTNGAEKVIKILYKKRGLGKRRLFYKDTCQQIDELKYDENGNFLGVSFGHDPYELSY
jgi:hypothetical protein